MAITNIKKLNLEEMQRPKTLIVIHYRGKRVSIPIFESIDNIVEYLWHQLDKFENTVLNQQEKAKNNQKNCSISDIVGFTAIELDKYKIDIKMNILLSMSRIGKDYAKSRSDLRQLDITNYYKYLEIQPYYAGNSKQLIPEYQLYSVLATTHSSTTYLGRKISDGRFYSIKICRTDSKLGQNEYNTMRILHREQQKMDRKIDLQIIPQVDQVRKTDGLFIFILEYCPGGNLRYAIRNKLSEIQCLHYMKQLIWGIHTLNSYFNLIHRAVCFENIQMDFVGNLRLVNYAYSQPCYANTYLAQSNRPESYQEKYQIPHVISPPQVQRSGKYNHLVDYFGVGVILQDMFGSGLRKSQTSKQKEGIQIAIQNLMAENIRDRQLFVNEVISELHEEKMRNYSSRSKSNENIEHERLTFNKIYAGQSINIEEKTENGIKHQQAYRILKPSNDDNVYFLNPVNKNRKKSKDKSKSKGKQKEHQVKEKSKSKTKKEKVSSNKNLLGSGKKSHQGSQKSLNKSMDSRNNSVKSSKSNESREKKKQNKVRNGDGQKKITPNIPHKNRVVSNMKSPPKNPAVLTSTQLNSRSPPKLIINKSKNKL